MNFFEGSCSRQYAPFPSQDLPLATLEKGRIERIVVSSTLGRSGYIFGGIRVNFTLRFGFQVPGNGLVV